ncbi:unnamed protein product [Chilo suppressalis]|uniref:Dendritic cell-specific transmembrane protein-like domain-containing protein n=1 Tax=Chilo suppressalis TaxID=168631 RepID=A0ABN8B5Z9_CHISP|nr:unnamed protein product [Chilo suppressalis]
MAYFALLWKARTIEKYRLNYESEKINSIMMSKNPMPKQSLSQRWRHYRYDTQKRISRNFRRWYPEGSSMSNFLLYLRTDQTFPNFVLKSILGFVGGIILTYLCFMFFVFQLSISLMHATIMSSVIGVLLTLGLAFSYRIRCLVFLLVPQFFSRVGRYTLTCYALVLILTGPATNTLKNSEVLSESLACGQEQIKTSVGHIKTLMDRPLNSLKDSVKVMVEKLRAIAVKMKAIILKVNRLILSLTQVINTGYFRLNSLTNVCNERLGTPYRRCIHSFQDGIEACKSTFGSNESSFCNTGKVVKNICTKYKHNLVFVFFEHLSGNIVPIVKRRLKNFSERIKHMFYLEVHVHHSYSFSSNTSRTACQVAAGIVTEIRKRADPLLTWLSWSSYVTSLFLLLIIFRAKSYQHMFETRSRFDNRYITKDIRILDLKRQRERREAILPLNRREQAKYVTTTSFRLVASEKAYLSRSVVFMTITTFKLMIHMIADYSLYWVLMTIRHHGRFQTPPQPGAGDTGIHISGSGLTADLLKSIVAGLSVLLESPILSPLSCLPNPSPPDLKRYTQIGVLILLLWFFSMFEPYGLRLRHVVMGHYQPDRAKTRAVWLYNHIIRARAGFMKLARRKLHRTYKYRCEELTFAQWLQHHIPFCWLRSLLGINDERPHCLLCGTVYDESRPDTQLIRCKSANCPGAFCDSCFADIGELCTICLAPEDYGDLSDVSIEKGSSEDSDESDDDSGFSKISAICKLNISKISRSSTKLCERYKSSIFSRNKSEQQALIPLISKRNDKIDFSNNYTDKCALESPRKDIKKSIRLRRRYISTDACVYHYDKKEQLLCQFNDVDYETFNFDICIIFDKLCIAYNDFILTEVKAYYDQVYLNHKAIKYRCYKTNKLKCNVKNFKNKKKFSARKSPKDVTTLKDSKCRVMPTDGTKSVSQCSFYRIILAPNSIKIQKIIKNTKLLTDMAQYFKTNIKCKMKRKRKKSKVSRGMKCLRRTYQSKFLKPIVLSNDVVTFSSYSNHGQKSAFNSYYSEKSNDSKVYKKDKYFRKYTQVYSGSCNGLQKLRSLVTNYWKNIVANGSSEIQVTISNTKSDTFVSKESKNYKRRKKKESNQKTCCTSDDVGLRSDGVGNEETRKYRISAFISDQEWIKRQWKKRTNTHTNFNSELDVACNYINEALPDNKSISIKNKVNGRKSHPLHCDNNLLKGDTKYILQNQGVTVTETHFTVKDVCKKYGCDLITVTSSNTSMEKILKAVRQVFEKGQHEDTTAKCTPFNKYKEFYESVTNIGAMCKGGCWEDAVEVENEESEECPSECGSEETCDPYIIFSDGSCTKSCLLKKPSANIKFSLKNFGSDLSDRLKNGVKSSLTFLKNLRNSIKKSNCWTRRQKTNKKKNCDKCCNPQQITGNDLADISIQSNHKKEEEEKQETGAVCCCSYEKLNSSSDVDADVNEGDIRVEKRSKTSVAIQKISSKADMHSKATGNKANASTITKKPLGKLMVYGVSVSIFYFLSVCCWSQMTFTVSPGLGTSRS